MSEQWITVKAPKSLYLPTISGSGEFKDSGRRVEPSDDIQLLPGTNRIRLNGMDLSLTIPCNNIPIRDGVIALSRPNPPVRLSTGGDGWAVGRSGEAQGKARGGWDHQAAEKWEGDAGTHAAPSPYAVVSSQMDTATPVAAFGLEECKSLFSDKTINDAFDDPNIEIREVSLTGGGTAHARFDKRTGKQVGTPFRQYQAHYGDGGQQISAPAPTHGPNSTFDMQAHKAKRAEKYRQYLDAQNATAVPALTAAERYDIEQKREQEQAKAQAPAPLPVATTGTPHLDNIIAGQQGVAGGFPLGKVTHLYGDEESTKALIPEGTPTAQNIAAAFGHIHLLKPGQQIVIIDIADPKPTTALRLAIAEELPVLLNMVSTMPVAVVIQTPDWNESDTPALLRLALALRIHVEKNQGRQGFIKVTVIKDPLGLGEGRTSTFPG